MNQPLSTSLTRRAFTVTELLVVITLIIILVLIAVPSFSAMIYSSEESLAESQLRAAMRAARDAAVRSNGAADGAAVFFFEPGGRLTVLPCVKVGDLSDWTDLTAVNAQSDDLTRREVFAAAPGFSAVTLPKYWMVRGFAPANSLSALWYGAGNPRPAAANATTFTTTNAADRQWVFPETGFFNVEGHADGYHRSTFMVRFRAGTGELVGSTTAPVLVFSPRNSSADRTGPLASARADRAEDPVRFVRQVLSQAVSAAHPASEKRLLLGRACSDMVLARPVMQVALYNENRLAAALGARLDRDTDSLYKAPPLGGNGLPDYSTYVPKYVEINGTAQTALLLGKISRFVEGDTNFDNTVDDEDKPDVRLFGIDRYSGGLRRLEVQP